MKLIKNSILTALFAFPFMFAGCGQDVFEPAAGGNHRSISLTVTAAKDASTRTTLAENADGDLDCRWQKGDYLIVARPDGTKIGELGLQPDADNAAVATFRGTVEYGGEEKLNFIYPGTNTTAGENASTVTLAEQSGTVAGLTGQDVLTATAQVSAFEGGAKADLGVMHRKLAFGRFRLSFPEGVDAKEAARITIGGTGLAAVANLSWAGDMTLETSGVGMDMAVDVDDASADFYLALVPQPGIEPKFTVTLSDGRSWIGGLVARDWFSGEYVRKDNGDGTYGAVTVAMTEVGGDAEDMPQGVGPVITLNGKKWQFVDGNLWYNVDTEQFGIYAQQTYYDYKFGKGVINKPATYGSAYLGYDVIDHFSWGATGIGDYTQNPQTICKIGGTNSDRENYSGIYYPFADQSAASNSSFTNLLKPVSMDRNEADFGYAYMVTGRKSSDTREYITPPLDAFKQVFATGNVVQGCTIKGAGIDGSNVTGLIVIPGMTVAEAKARIAEIGCKYTSSIGTLYHNNGGSTFNVTAVTLNSTDDLKQLNNALFFPTAGTGSPCAELEKSGYTSFSKTAGSYWSADANQGSSTTANGKRLWFSDKSGFFYNGGSNNSSYSRHGKLSVRLLVEVPE